MERLKKVKQLFRRHPREQGGNETDGQSRSRNDDNSGVGPDVVHDSVDRPDDEKSVDIVFVHGLRSTRIGIWSKGSTFWPRDFLKDDVKIPARIITWGYDSSGVQALAYPSKESIFGHAETLLGDISSLRAGRKYSIIFVGHSLGGLVIKEALIKASAYLSHGRHHDRASVYADTSGVIFLGTPHRGSGKQTYAEILAAVGGFSLRQLNKELLRVLKTDSHILENQRDQFTTISKDLPVVCVREELPTAIGMIVPEASASYDGFNVKRDAIRANHMDMARFSSKDEIGYRRILGHIIELSRLSGVIKTQEGK